ncbi:hypothetical protein [Actinophytocola algeriensis]|uniref:Uncharacterized protein n=1 Tax=Actinophytocola algeriensis TaxID=1768010 RepID=A0A7W7QD34_9PSEU|nr:hypothetical protein [Actinophytocola algeriensis]MBB4911335.1 hypothetical protein [Actinophytocola algeriensis]MBE1479274.1 hypothetical protein [Actinophytocola algeriensis]
MTGFHMVPDVVSAAVTALSDQGKHRDTGWQGCKSAIAGNEGGIGPDPLGQAFRAIYGRLSPALREGADRVPGLIMDVAGRDARSVGDYVGSDAVAGPA